MNALRPSSAASFAYPVEECFTYTYQLRLGNATADDVIHDAWTHSSGHQFLAGYTAPGGGPRQALLLKLDLDGSVLWSRTFSGAGRLEAFNSVRELPNGHLVVMGTSTLPDGSDHRLRFAELDTDGEPTWTRSLAAPGYEAAALVTSKREGTGFAAHDDSTILYGRLDATGQTVWTRTLCLLDRGRVIGLQQYEYDAWYIGYSGSDGGRKAGSVARIKPATGAVEWVTQMGGAAANSDYIFHDMSHWSGRPDLTGIFSEANAPYRLLRVEVQGDGVVYRQPFETPGITFDETAHTLLGYGSTLAFSPSLSAGEVGFIHSPSMAYPEPIVDWTRKHALPAGYRLAALRRTFDGGYLLVSNGTANGSKEIFLLKTDSTASVKSCDGTPFAVQSAIQYNNNPYVKLQKAGQPLGVATHDEALAGALTPLASAFSCRSASCPPRSAEPACIPSFHRGYRGTEFQDYFSSLALKGDKLWTAGYTFDITFEPTFSAVGTLAAFDTKGKLLDRKKVRLGDETTVLQKIITLQNGDLLVVGNTIYRDTTYFTLSRFTAALQPLWHKGFPAYAPYSGKFGVVEDGSGSLFFHYQEGWNPFSQDVSLLHLSATGDLLWARNYTPTGVGTFVTDYRGALLQDDDHLYAGFDANGDLMGHMIMKISKATGSVVWSNLYKLNGGNSYLDHSFQNLSFVGDNLVLHGTLYQSSPYLHKTALTVIGKDGRIKRAKTFGLNGMRESTPVNGHELLLAGTSFNAGTTYRAVTLHVDSSLNVLHSRYSPGAHTSVSALQGGADGMIYENGHSFFRTANITEAYIRKYAPNGLVGNCANDTLNPAPEVAPMLSTAVPMTLSTGVVTLETVPYAETGYALQENQLYCTSSCEQLQVQGVTSVCDTAAATYTYRVVKNVGCTAPVIYATRGAGAVIVQATADSVRVRFTGTGSVWLTARLLTGCQQWLADSLEIQTAVVPGRPQLGKDTVLCPGNTLRLHAGSGYSAYQWQDGSTDPVFVVTAPGTYHVTAATACGATYRDTLVVHPHAPSPFSIGADRTKCDSDTLVLLAPAGFSNYSWSPAYSLSATTGQQVVVNPAADTAYYVRAEEAAGCFVYDTVRVTVYTSPPLSLGRDTSFCSGDSLVLQAGTGFSRYLWSGGSTAPQLTVQQAGTYTLQATTAEGCTARDTLTVTAVHRNPTPTLDRDPRLCTGSTRTLDAGNYTAYEWQDGSPGRTFTVSGPGTYRVVVSDRNGCTGSDSVTITTLLPLPKGFLPPDTAMCSYSTVLLRAQQVFSRYTWSTGSAAPSLAVSEAGVYWLRVTDAEGCTGSDSTTVTLKECLQGLYVPTAFTPNNDGRNDQLRALLFGPVQQFEFTVYNRWGEVIFRTTDRQAGWNGTYKGKTQDSGVFAWICRYQLAGGEEKMEKGTATLIR